MLTEEWFSSEPRAQEPVPHPEPGSLVGGCYRILRTLGSGAMGTVLLAQDEVLDRRVAIKFVRPNNLDASAGKQFLDEARAMARVCHPNVVQVYACGEHEESPYFVMEFVEGRTLGRWLEVRSAPAELDVALQILNDLCLGVAAIHAQETVHYDIKPSNILLDSALRPRVADLGLAVMYRYGQRGNRGVIGTPAYMAPEIAFSKVEDTVMRSRVDVYSLACVAYELLTGRLPFDGQTNVAILLQHAADQVAPPSAVRADLPHAFDGALLRALRKDPCARTPSIEAFRRDLAAARLESRDPTRLLVADDDDGSREGLRRLFAQEFPNADIACVPDGLAALEAFERHRPSVAILDLCMPGLDGLALTQRFREKVSSAAMPIIILTGSGGPDEWTRLAALGADRFLVKPVITADLVDLIRRVIR